jgi:hypothetical protein
MDKNDKHSITGGQFGNQREDFKVRSATSGIAFDFYDVLPPTALYIGVDDQLITSFIGTQTNSGVTINLRILGLDGLIHPMLINVPSNNNQTAAIRTFPLMEGFLLSAAAFLGGLPTTSTPTFISAGIGRAPFTAQSVYFTLFSGYLYNSQPLSYPEMPPIRQSDATPWYKSFSWGAPAAGADFSVTIPVGQRWRVVSCSGLLTTAVAVANRDVTLVIDDGANVMAQIPAGFALLASLTNQYTFADSCVQSAAFNAVSVAPLPSNLILTAGMRVRTVTANIQAADQWSVGFLHIGEVFESL